MTIYDKVDHIKGFFSAEDVLSVIDIVDLLPDTVDILEIGSYQGRSTVAWAEACIAANKEYSIHCIDNHDLTTGQGRKNIVALVEYYKSILAKNDVSHDIFKLFDVEKFPILVNYFENNIEGEINFFKNTAGYNVSFEETTFTTSSFEWDSKGKMFDCIFYDANHSYEYTFAAAKYWGQFLKPGGYMCFHDYSAFHPGVVDSLDDYYGKENIIKFYKNSSVVAIKKDV